MKTKMETKSIKNQIPNLIREKIVNFHLGAANCFRLAILLIFTAQNICGQPVNDPDDEHER